MLLSDDRSKLDPTVLADPRSTQFWDQDKIAGKWFAQNVDHFPNGSTSWDAYYLYVASARWNSSLPPFLATGHPVLSAASNLQRALKALPH